MHGSGPVDPGLRAAALRGELDIWAGKSENRDAWVPADVAEKIPEQSDILDPFTQGPSQFARMASDIERVLPPVARALGQTIGHRA